MSDMNIQNRTRNPYKVPLVPGEIDIASDRMISVGGAGLINADKHAVLMKASKAYRAMVEQGKLRVTKGKVESVDADSLENTSNPVKPSDLESSKSAQGAEGAIDVKVESEGVTLAEVPSDAPAKNAKRSAPPKKA